MNLASILATSSCKKSFKFKILHEYTSDKLLCMQYINTQVPLEYTSPAHPYLSLSPLLSSPLSLSLPLPLPPSLLAAPLQPNEGDYWVSGRTQEEALEGASAKFKVPKDKIKLEQGKTNQRNTLLRVHE